MVTEIELKAWVDDPESLKARIASLACFSLGFEKKDAYWHPLLKFFSGSVPPSWVRIRKEKDCDPEGRISWTIWVTYKTKELRDGIEVNDEYEFSVSDDQAFAELLKRLGFEQGIRKYKRGWAWDYEGIRVELADIADLGWFLELELAADNNRTETITDARARLLICLQQIGVSEDKIETRYYTEMLREGAGRK